MVKMHPKSNKKCMLFILLSIYFPAFFSQMTQENDDCAEPLQCGSTNISYPFWGGRRTPSFGRPGFEIHCQRDVPLLNMSSVFYRILEIDFSNHTLRIAREDLWNKTCPSNFHNTTIDPNLFEFPPDSKDLNVTLYFNCTSYQEKEWLLNQFRCDGDGVNTVNLFRTGDASSVQGSNMTCKNNISVPLTREAAESLKNATTSSIDVVQAALAAGFSVRWLDSVIYASDSDEPRGSSLAKNPVDSSLEIELNYSPIGNGSYPGPLLMGMVGGLMLGIIGTTILIVKIVCCVKRQHSSCSPNQESNPDIEKILPQHGPLAPNRYKYSEIRKITKSFTDKLGQGGYGIVYKGILPNGRFVAIKVLVDNNSDGEEFINEVASISRTSHINIVSLLGFCYDQNRRALVYEFMPNKSLDKWMLSNGDCQLDMKKLYKIALGVARGLEYLHRGCNTKIVHFDIKPQNILLDEEFCPKISDFGLAKLCKRKQSILSMLGTRGTIGYIAPEIFSRNFGGVSHKCDVYSYGMMVLEMIGARKNVETEAIQSSENYFLDTIYNLIIRDVTRKLEDFVNEEEDDTMRKMSLVGFWCIQTTPADRPSMSKVVEMLEGNLHSIQIPPKPVLFFPEPMVQGCFLSLSIYAATENSIGPTI